MPRPTPATYQPVSEVDDTIRMQHLRDGIAADSRRHAAGHRGALIARAAHPVLQALRARLNAADQALATAESLAAADATLAALETDFNTSKTALREGIAAIFDKEI